jgi:hypothetical protein
VKGERIVVGNRVFDLCPKDRKVIDTFMVFDREYGITLQQAERDARKVAELEARTIPERRVAAAAVNAPSQTTEGRRVKCGLCLDAGQAVEVAHNSRAYHAQRYHDGLKISDIDWR